MKPLTAKEVERYLRAYGYIFNDAGIPKPPR